MLRKDVPDGWHRADMQAFAWFANGVPSSTQQLAYSHSNLVVAARSCVQASGSVPLRANGRDAWLDQGSLGRAYAEESRLDEAICLIEFFSILLDHSHEC
jgi:hypothetical protein